MVLFFGRGKGRHWPVERSHLWGPAGRQNATARDPGPVHLEVKWKRDRNWEKTLASLSISTGHLPTPEQVSALVAEAHRGTKPTTDGQVSQVYPALARVPRDLFGVCVVGASGSVYAVGDTEHPFSIMSVSKPFVFALVCEAIGAERGARRRSASTATGLPFNSLAAVERSADGRTNPMVNSGAIATTSLVPGRHLDDQVAVHPRRSVPVRRPHAAAERRGLRVGLGNQLPQPEHRPDAASCGRDLLRSGRSDRPLHQAVLARTSARRIWR